MLKVQCLMRGVYYYVQASCDESNCARVKAEMIATSHQTVQVRQTVYWTSLCLILHSGARYYTLNYPEM